jgi:hypothetical protein
MGIDQSWRAIFIPTGWDSSRQEAVGYDLLGPQFQPDILLLNIMSVGDIQVVLRSQMFQAARRRRLRVTLAVARY